MLNKYFKQISNELNINSKTDKIISGLYKSKFWSDLTKRFRDNVIVYLSNKHPTLKSIQNIPTNKPPESDATTKHKLKQQIIKIYL